jgi:hypothetical protein
MLPLEPPVRPLRSRGGDADASAASSASGAGGAGDEAERGVASVALAAAVEVEAVVSSGRGPAWSTRLSTILNDRCDADRGLHFYNIL